MTITLVTASVHAQTSNEWLRQKKTQRNYLIKQIGLLQLYLGYLKKGYEIVHGGLTTIENIKDGNFSLHRDFFNHLKEVNPRISNSAKVADIIAYQAFIVKQLKKVNEYCRSNKSFSVREAQYVNDVFANMLLITDANISELWKIIQSNESEMNDDERIQRIDKLYDETMDQFAFAKSFSRDAYHLGAMRDHERFNIEQMRTQREIL